MQAPSLFDGFPFDAFPPLENGRSSSEVNVDRCQVVQALVIAPIVVVLAELADAQLGLARRRVVLQQGAVLHGAVIALDLALRHRVVRTTADMTDAFVLEPIAKFARDVGWTIIAQQPRPM